MSPQFGFGVGDLLVIGGLARKLATALKDSRGSVVQFTSLIELLNSLATCLTDVSLLILNPPEDTSLKPDQAFVNGILYQSGCCYRLINQFLSDARQYTDSFVSQKGKSVQKQWRKIQWTLYKDDDVRKLERRLQSHLEAFQTYLIAISLQSHIWSTNRIQGRLDHIDRSLVELATFVQVSNNTRPRELGYSWQGDNGGSGIFLEDVLGRSHEIPAVFGRNLRAFQDALEIMFRDLPGHSQVLKGDYEIVDKTTGALLTFGIEGGWDGKWKEHNTLLKEEQWQTKAGPGSRFDMSIIQCRDIGRSTSSLLSLPGKRCPRCQTTTSGIKNKGFIPCHICGLQFNKSIQEISVLDYKSDQNVLKPLVFGMTDYTRIMENRLSNNQEFQDQGEKTTAALGNFARDSYDPKSFQLEEAVFRRIHYFDHTTRPHSRVENADMEKWWKYSRSPLIQATAQGDACWVHRLLLDGANPSFPDYNDRLPIQYAAASGNIEVVQLLVDSGSDVNASSRNSARTALQSAVTNGHVEMTKYLISLGANINASPAYSGGRTALQAAAERGDADIVTLLLSHGADINAEPSIVDGLTVVQAAASGGHEELVKMLISKNADFTTPVGHSGVTTVQAAAGSGHASILKLLLSYGAAINTPLGPPDGLTALQAAASNGHEQVVEILISLGADVNAPPRFDCGRTALQAASENGSLSIVRRLLKAGADINANGARRHGLTALQAAANTDRIEIAKFLLDNGAEINAPAEERLGLTALQAAVDEGHVNMVKLLLSCGADVNAPGPTGIGKIPPRGTALFLASLKNLPAIVHLLQQAGAKAL